MYLFLPELNDTKKSMRSLDTLNCDYFKIMFMYPIQIILRLIVHEHYNDAKDSNDVIILISPPSSSTFSSTSN